MKYEASSAEYIVSGIKRHTIAAVIAVVAQLIGGVSLAAYLHARNTEVAIESIAVLPFENQHRDASVEWLSDGVTESIINNLAQLPNLRVSPRSTVFHYKGAQVDPLAVGKELGVRAVLSGRFRQTGDDVTISVELVDIRDNKQLWGDRFNHKAADALMMQQEISQQISERLRLNLPGAEQQKMMALLRTLHAGGRTIVIVTHTPWVIAEYTERVVLLADGRLRYDGPVRPFFGDDQLLAAAAFRPPDVTRLGRLLGCTPLSVEELLSWMGRRPAPCP